ncbi:hypothetical protein ACQJBY_035161 [Aegilops geniculata]
MYTISIFITSAPQKKYLYYQHNGLVVVTTACVEVFMAPRLSFRVSTKLRDSATTANLSPAFKSVRFYASHGGQPRPEHRLLHLRDGRCLALPRKHHDGHNRPCPARRHGRHHRNHLPVQPTLADRLSHNLLHNYLAAASMKMQYIS